MTVGNTTGETGYSCGLTPSTTLLGINSHGSTDRAPFVAAAQIGEWGRLDETYPIVRHSETANTPSTIATGTTIGGMNHFNAWFLQKRRHRVLGDLPARREARECCWKQ